MNNHYNKKLKTYSRELRNESVSKAEKFIWKSILSRKQLGISFKRQRPIDNFIVDFFSKEILLIIEIDGSSHFNKESYDRFRQDKLEKLGYTFVRFSEGEVLNNLSDIAQNLKHIIHCLQERSCLPPFVPLQRRKC